MKKEDMDKVKAKIYQQIDKIEDETALQMLQEASAVYSTPSQKDIIDELTPEQQQRLKDSILQANDGKTISNEEVQQKAKEWLSR